MPHSRSGRNNHDVGTIGVVPRSEQRRVGRDQLTVELAPDECRSLLRRQRSEVGLDCSRSRASPTGTYTGDPRLGLSAREAFSGIGPEMWRWFGWVGPRCWCRRSSSDGRRSYRLGHELVDEFLEFASGRCRPNTVRAYAHDLKAFFTVVGKDPCDVTSRDVLAFVRRPAAPSAGRRESGAHL